jgi:hypothetical protein
MKHYVCWEVAFVNIYSLQVCNVKNRDVRLQSYFELNLRKTKQEESNMRSEKNV